MFEINLIRDKAILPEFKRKISRYFKIGGLICFLVLSGISAKVIALSLKISEYKKMSLRVSSEFNKMIKKHNITAWGKEWQETYRHMNLINNIVNDRTGWVIRLIELEKFLPSGMCIDRISVLKNNKIIELRLIALVEKQAEFDKVKQFIGSLEKSSIFGKGAKMTAQKSSKIKGKDVNLFRISVPISKKES